MGALDLAPENLHLGHSHSELWAILDELWATLDDLSATLDELWATLSKRMGYLAATLGYRGLLFWVTWLSRFGFVGCWVDIRPLHRKCQCPKGWKHEPVQGSNAKRSAVYTWGLAQALAAQFTKASLLRHLLASPPIPALSRSAQTTSCSRPGGRM